MRTESIPKLAAIHYQRDLDINAMLRSIAKGLQKHGLKVGGVLQQAEWLPHECCARLYIVDIRTGQCERIKQNRGAEARGCKLDPQGLAAISHCITDAIEAGSDLIIINKYGRAESEERGLLSCFADAASAAIPTLTTVRDPYVDQWRAFHGGLATELSANEAVEQWIYEAWLSLCRSHTALMISFL